MILVQWFSQSSTWGILRSSNFFVMAANMSNESMAIEHLGIRNSSDDFVKVIFSVEKLMPNNGIYSSWLCSTNCVNYERGCCLSYLTDGYFMNAPEQDSKIHAPYQVERNQKAAVFLQNSYSVCRNIWMINRQNVIENWKQYISHPH